MKQISIIYQLENGIHFLNIYKIMKKKLVLILLLILSLNSCKPTEERIYDHSYTLDWYYLNNQRYQVYQTKNHTKYILVLNKKESQFIRKYLK